MSDHMKLTVRQECFLQEYIRTDNASEAYRRAYPRSQRWKESSVNCNASQLLNSTKVQQRLDELRAYVKEKSEVTIQDVVDRLVSHAFTCLSDVASLNGNRFSFKDWDELSDAQKAAFKKIKVRSRHVKDANGGYHEVEHIEIELYDQQRALELLGKHLGMFVERTENTHAIVDRMEEQKQEYRAIFEAMTREECVFRR